MVSRAGIRLRSRESARAFKGIICDDVSEFSLARAQPSSVDSRSGAVLHQPCNDAYAVPRRGFITKVERAGDRVRLFGDIELVQKHLRSYDIVRKPLQSIAADALKRSAPECRYLVTDGESRVVLAGQVLPTGDANFSVDLTGKLPAGRFTLVVQIIVNGNAMNAEIQRIPFEIVSKP